MENNNATNVNNITNISNIKNGEVVTLPPFFEGQDFTVRLRKPSILGLCQSGLIPNSLLYIAQSLFGGKVSDSLKNEKTFKETAELFHIIAKNALVDPTLEEIEKEGLFLTDLQYLAIFNYTQMGVKALEPFRKK